MSKLFTSPFSKWQFVADQLGAHRFVLLCAIGIVVCFVALAPDLMTYGVFAIIGLFIACIVSPRTRVKETKGKARGIKKRGELERIGIEAFIQSLFMPVIIFQRNGDIYCANGVAEQAFGKLPKQTSLIARFRTPEMVALFQQLASEGGSGQVEYVRRSPVERWFNVHAQSLVGHGDIFVLVFDERSQLRNVERMRTDFIANASHELRTPLSSITGFIEAIKGPAGEDPKQRSRFLDIMQSQAERMARLVDDLLSLSRLEAKPLLPPSATVDLVELVPNVVESMRPLAHSLDVDLELDITSSNALVHGANDELIQVLENLIANGCKYAQSGRRLRISIEPAQMDGQLAWSLSVQDFGPGIHADEIARITERFYRVDGEVSHQQKGTGLGLSIVKHIIARHHGRLDILSQIGNGSTFKVTLIKKDDDDDLVSF